MKVLTALVADDVPAGLADLAPRGGEVEIRVVRADGLPQALLDTDGLLLWDFFSPAAQDALVGSVPARLDWVHVAASGVDRILTPAVVSSPVRVTRAVGVFERPIAEYVLACVCAHLKQLWTTRAHGAERRWHQRETGDLAGARVLVVGAGRIGQEVGGLLAAVGMHVQLVGRAARQTERGRVLGAEHLVDLLPSADVVVLALPATPATAGLFDRRHVEAMAQGSYLVNVGRGTTLDEGALADAVRTGRVAGAALDALSTEPLPAQDPLWELPGVFVSPHLSSRTHGWRAALFAQFADQFRRWTAGEPLAGEVLLSRGY